MQREIRCELHSIILTIGPSFAGKTFWCQEVLVPQLRALAPQLHVSYVSSDEIRQDLLGVSTSNRSAQRHDHQMKDVSEAAFNLLYTKIESLACFPVKAEFIIVDTTGLGEVFRSKIQALADKHHYSLSAVVFNYRSYEAYFQGVTDVRAKKIISDQVKRFRQKVLPELKPSIYSSITRITDRLPKESYRITIPKLNEYVATQLDPDLKYVVIGDIHECVDELKALLQKNRVTIRPDNTIESPFNQKFILVGDYVDKGQKLAEIIDFLTLNRDAFIIVRGNHEDFTYRHLDDQDTIKKEHFSSIHQFRQNPVLAEKFRRLYESSLPFVWCRGTFRSSFIVTHAPCSSRFLGKLDSKSLKAQLVSDPSLMSISRDSPDFIPALRKILDKGTTPSMYHIFGHFAGDRVFRYQCNLGIDTGCIGGGKLTSVFISDGDVYFKSQPFLQLQPQGSEQIVTIPTVEATSPDVDLSALQETEVSRLNYILRNRINFISGTMCPADKSDNELESLDAGLEYYRRHKVETVVLQPKYMGSRCTIYLDRDVTASYATSRNGYKITRVFTAQPLSSLFETLLTQFRDFMEKEKILRLVLDGELLPWEALGKKLIGSHFGVIDAALMTELHALQESGFEAELTRIAENPEFVDFAKKSGNTKKTVLQEQFNDRSSRLTWTHFLEIRPYLEPMERHCHDAATYHAQVQLYGQSTPLTFKPFSVLKIVYLDGREVLPELDPNPSTTSSRFVAINPDPIEVISLNSSEALEKARIYYTSQVKAGQEGIVIKPKVLTESQRKVMAPYLKVRNPEYLTLVYGYDYRHPRRLSELLENKSIRKKLQMSIIEANLGLQMLQYRMPLQESDEPGYRQLVANMIFETRKEETLDPRL